MSGIFAKVFEHRESPTTQQVEQRGWETVVVEAMRANASSAGSNVTPDNALRMSAVFACIRILAEDVASLPLFIYERQARGRRKAQEFYLYELLHDRPNPAMTAMEYREAIQAAMAAWGNAYSKIETGSGGQIVALWPLLPGSMMQTTKRNGLKYYQFQLADGKMEWYPEDEIWHLHGLGDDGERGYSPISLMRRAIGLGLSAEEFGAKFFENDARPGIVLEHPARLGDQAYKHLTEDWNQDFKGSSKSHKMKVLEEGMKIHEVGIPPEDAQFLETRKFQVQEIARIFRIPPHMLADLDRATFSNIEQQSIDYVRSSLRPWLVRWEQSIDKNLMLPAERKQFYAEHLVEGLLRGDIQSRYGAYAQGRQNGWLSANDIRELENMDPVDGGDTYLVPLNMVPADQEGAGNSSANGADNNQVDEEDSQAGEEDLTQSRKGFKGEEARGVVEKRSRAAAAERSRLAVTQSRVFEDVSGQIVRRERQDVKRKAESLILAGKIEDFKRWLEGFYEEHAGWSAAKILPYALAYSELVARAVEGELGESDLAAKIEAYVREYVADFGQRESAQSHAWMLDRMDKLKDGTPEEVLAGVGEQLDGWVDTRPAAMAKAEAIRQSGAFAVTLYGLIGVTKIMSVATGKSSCPYCKHLDGKVIGIEKYFLNAGEEFNPEGAQSKMLITHSMRHSPYHGGCDCMTVSGG